MMNGMEPKRIRDDEFAVSPSGLHIGHTQTEVDYLVKIVERENPQGFIEVGVHIGGLADTLIPKVASYLGIEIDSQIISKIVHDQIAASPNASLFIGDAWELAATLECCRWMRGKRPIFIYCDGGNKPLELDLYSDEARAGDLVGVHDYGIYEGAEIDPEYADALMLKRGFVKYEPSFRPPLVRIEVWRK